MTTFDEWYDDPATLSDESTNDLKDAERIARAAYEAGARSRDEEVRLLRKAAQRVLPLLEHASECEVSRMRLDDHKGRGCPPSDEEDECDCGLSRKAILSIFLLESGSLYVNAGCFNGTPREFLAAVNKTHGTNEHAKAYARAIKAAEALWPQRRKAARKGKR